MKIILTESQYNLLLEQDRVEYLRGQNVANDNLIEKAKKSMDKRDVYDADLEGLKLGDKNTKSKGPQIVAVQGEGEVMAYLVRKGNKIQVKLTEPTFQIFVDADPSPNKQYIQWIIDVFKKHIKQGGQNDIEEAQRFVIEDMDQATEALDLFHCVKNRNKFRLNAKDRPGAPQNPKDIRQYDSVGQLYTVVSGFDCNEDDSDEEGGDTGGLSKKGYKLFKEIMGYVKLGQAEVHKLSDRIMIYQPKTLQSSCEPLGSLANWCTRATPSGGVGNETGNEWFHKYRGSTGEKSRLRPGGKLSEYYVILPIELFQIERPSDHPSFPYQIHFESNQLHDKSNRGIGDSGINDLINKYPELVEFFRKELGDLSAQSIRSGTGLMDNKYIKYLNMFGGKVEEYVPKEDYDEGIKSIKVLAKQEKGPVNNNKYLKWLLSNEDDINIVEYIPLDIENLNLSDINLGTLPDLSMFKSVDQLIAGKCNLTTMPTGDKLPPNMSILGLPNNNLTNISFEGYSEYLKFIMVINVYNNPIQTIDVDTLTSLLDQETLARFAVSNPSSIQNYDEYLEMVNSFEDSQDEELQNGGGFGTFLDV